MISTLVFNLKYFRYTNERKLVCAIFILSFYLSLAIAAIIGANEHHQHTGTAASPWSMNNLLRKDQPANLATSLETRQNKIQRKYILYLFCYVYLVLLSFIIKTDQCNIKISHRFTRVYLLIRIHIIHS